MTEDFAKQGRRQAPPPARSGLPTWVWFASGTVFGAFVTALLFLTTLLPASIDRESTDAPATESGSADDDGSEPSFTFYDLLRDTEVSVPDAPPAEPAQPRRYQLQAGSFQDPADADALRARLILLGHAAVTREVRLEDGTIWHRVLIGPIESDDELSRIRVALAAESIDAFPLRIQ